MTVEDQIKELEEEIKSTPYNKATQKHIGLLKAKLARLKAQPKKGGGGGLGYSIRKAGDATIILVGFPSVGKSTLLNRLTNAQSPVAEYDFTTLKVIPGVLEYRGARIQVLDIPGIIEEASSGRGRGREVLSVMRNADLLIIIIAGKGWERQKQVIEQELYLAGFRLNQKPPDVKLSLKNQGGIRVEAVGRLDLSEATITDVLKEFRIHNAEILVRERIGLDQLIDCLAKNRIYLPAVFVLNKADIFSGKTGKNIMKISALKNEGIENLKEVVWRILDFKRIYLKKPGKEPDMKEPLVIRGFASVRTVCTRLNLLNGFKYARVWGPSARFPGQKVGLEHGMKDRDILEIHN